MRFGSKAQELSRVHGLFEQGKITKAEFGAQFTAILADPYRKYELGLTEAEEAQMLLVLVQKNIISEGVRQEQRAKMKMAISRGSDDGLGELRQLQGFQTQQTPPENNQPKPKKPLYKRIWVWAAIAVVVFIAYIGIGNVAQEQQQQKSVLFQVDVLSDGEYVYFEGVVNSIDDDSIFIYTETGNGFAQKPISFGLSLNRTQADMYILKKYANEFADLREEAPIKIYGIVVDGKMECRYYENADIGFTMEEVKDATALVDRKTITTESGEIIFGIQKDGGAFVMLFFDGADVRREMAYFTIISGTLHDYRYDHTITGLSGEELIAYTMNEDGEIVTLILPFDWEYFVTDGDKDTLVDDYILGQGDNIFSDDMLKISYALEEMY